MLHRVLTRHSPPMNRAYDLMPNEQSMSHAGAVWHERGLMIRNRVLCTQVPGDNFVPGIVMGGLSGRLFGELLREADIHPGLTPGAFALLGAGAVLTGMSRMTITLVAILTEVCFICVHSACTPPRHILTLSPPYPHHILTISSPHSHHTSPHLTTPHHTSPHLTTSHQGGRGRRNHASDHPRIQKSANQHASRSVRTWMRSDQFLCPKFKTCGPPSCLLIDDATPGVREGMRRDAT